MSTPQYPYQSTTPYPPPAAAPVAYPPAGTPAGYPPAQTPAAYPPAQAPAYAPAQPSTAYAPAQQSPAGYPPANYAPANYAPANAAPANYAPAGYPPAQYGPPQTQPQATPGAGYPVAPPVRPQQTTQCRLCGSVPAADVTFRQHRGMILIMQFMSLRGPFCRDCGLATFRRMSAATLIGGWWGYASSVITPITLIINLTRRGRVANLPQPMPSPTGPSRRPLDPGPPLMSRPTALIGLAIPVFIVLLVIILVALGA